MGHEPRHGWRRHYSDRRLIPGRENARSLGRLAAGRRPAYYDLDLQDPEHYEVFAKLKDIDTPEGLTLSEELRQTVNQAIEDLPEDLRTAILLREIEGMSYEDIAITMDCPIGTVRSRIFRAREAIDAKLKPLVHGN